MLTLALASMLQFSQYAQCAPNVAPATMSAIVRVESSNNPYAIGVVDGALRRQPQSREEALAAVAELERQGKNYSMGLAQINKHNLPKYGITAADAFDPCTSLRVGGLILADCYQRALPRHASEQNALQAALSCYYSGNFTRGFRADGRNGSSYVQRVIAATNAPARSVPVPALGAIDAPAVALQPIAPAAPVAPAHSNSVIANDQVAEVRSAEAELSPSKTAKGVKTAGEAATASEALPSGPARLSALTTEPASAPTNDDTKVVF